MAIKKVTEYTGDVADPYGSQSQAEFTQNAFDQFGYLKGFSPDLNSTIDEMNTAINGIDQAISNVGYKGEWTPATVVEVGGIYGYEGSEWRSITGVSGVAPSYGDDWRAIGKGITYLPPVTASQGQTEFNLGIELVSVQVNRDGTIEQTDKWSYNKTTGVLTISSPADAGERFQFAYNAKVGDQVSPSTGGGFVKQLDNVASFASFDSLAESEFTHVQTKQHTKDGLGSAIYKKVSSGTPDAFGFVVQDASSQLWSIDFSANGGYLFFEQLGALPRENDIGPIIQKAMQVQNVTGCGLDHEVGDGFFVLSSAGPMLGGDFPTRIEMRKPGVIWSARDATVKMTILEAPVTVADNIKVSGITMLGSLVNDATIPAYNTDPAGYHNACSWCIDFSRCRNGSKLSDITVRGGANGVVATDIYYASMDNIDLRSIDPDGIGLFEYAVDFQTQVNVVRHTNIKLHNGSPSLGCVAINGAKVDGNSYHCQIENSDSTGAYFQGWRGTVLYNPYFENNNPNTTTASQATDIFVRDCDVTILGGLINSPDTGSADSKSIRHLGTGFVKLDGGLTFSKGGRSSAFEGNIIEGDYNPTDFNLKSLNKYNSSLSGGIEGLTRNENPAYAAATTLAIPYVNESMNALGTMFTIDLNTAQFREVWTFELIIAAQSHDDFKGGCAAYRLRVGKNGTSFYKTTSAVYGETKGGGLDWGTFTSTIANGQLTLEFTPLAGTTAAVRALLNPILCGSNSRITSIARG